MSHGPIKIEWGYAEPNGPGCGGCSVGAAFERKGETTP
jgi:hypothetical protein